MHGTENGTTPFTPTAWELINEVCYFWTDLSAEDAQLDFRLEISLTPLGGDVYRKLSLGKKLIAADHLFGFHGIFHNYQVKRLLVYSSD